MWYSINLLELKDLHDYDNRDMIMDRFEKKFKSSIGVLVYTKERILALDGTRMRSFVYTNIPIGLSFFFSKAVHASSARLVLIPKMPCLVTTAVTDTPYMNASKKIKGSHHLWTARPRTKQPRHSR